MPKKSKDFLVPENQKFSRPRKKKEKLVEEEEKPEESEKQDEGYVLIISEKPQAAMKIAYSLSEKAPVKQLINGVPYYELNREGQKIIVACAVGHLFSLTSIERGFPIFNVEWQPNFKIKHRGKSQFKDFTKKYYYAISQLAKNASSFIIATDYDIEGELIGYNIMRYILKHDAKRMKFSTLTKPDIEEAYEKVMQTINFGLAKSGETRHILDWYYGINLSRALMYALGKAGAFRIISVGRVQGPTLSFVVEKEKEIQKFKSKPYWQVFIIIDKNNLELKYVKNVENKNDLEKFQALKGKTALAITEKRQESLIPQIPFDLTTLQVEAYRLFGITPSQLLQTAQNLYLAGMISYPRTSSQKLPLNIGYKKIFGKLKENVEYEKLLKFAERKIPVEGKKEDAHPSIFPTGEIGKMNDSEKKVYDLIVKRFISCFCGNAEIENKTIKVKINDVVFEIKGLKIIERGWLNVYPIKLAEKEIEDVNGAVKILNVDFEEKTTQPPKRYSQASLVSELTRRNLGTKGTRASIIDTLYNRGYIKEKNIEATPFGMKLIDTLKKEAPIIIDEKLSRHFEHEIEEIEKGKGEQEKTIDEAKQVISKISSEFRSKAEKIGGELLEGHSMLRLQEKEDAKIMQCPACKKGSLVVRRSSIGKQFLACDAYPECKTTFSIPQFGLIKKAEKICECGFQRLLLIKKGKRPWEFCFNSQCPTRQQKEESS
jgi:DNA topoisomerase-1